MAYNSKSQAIIKGHQGRNSSRNLKLKLESETMSENCLVMLSYYGAGIIVCQTVENTNRSISITLYKIQGQVHQRRQHNYS